MSGFDPWTATMPTTPDMAKVTAKRLAVHMQGMSKMDPEYKTLVERLDQIQALALKAPSE
jgi:hypothetical protein